jgi:hypothetical protein
MTLVPSLQGLGRRTLSPRNRAGAWLAILTCPCHGALVLYLAAGTVFGSALFVYRGWMYAGLAVAFLAGLWMMVRRDTAVCPIEPAAGNRRDTSVAPDVSRSS